MALRIARIICVAAPKGGVGATTVAANLACALAKESGARVGAVEVGACGDLAMVLGVEPGVAPEGRSAGVDLLPSVAGDTVSGATLRAAHDFLIADLTGDPSEWTPAVDESDLCLLVTTADLLSIKRVRVQAGRFAEMHFPPERFRIVLNQDEGRSGMGVQDLQSLLPYPLLGTIPADAKALSAALSAGEPAVTGQPSSPFGKAVRGLAAKLADNVLYPARNAPSVRPLPRATPAPPIRSGQPAASGNGAGTRESHRISVGVAVDPWQTLKRRIHAELPRRVDLKQIDVTRRPDAQVLARLRGDVERSTETLLTEFGASLPDRAARERVVKEVADEALGLGPLEDLLRDEDVTEIMVVGPDRVYVERGGKLFPTGIGFSSEHQLRTVIERIVNPLGRRIDESQPLVDARLADGSRVNAVIPPLSLVGPVLTIRKFPSRRLTMEDLLQRGTITPAAASYLRACVEARKNVVISGGTGSGKTTLLNVLSSFIPRDERIVTIEDAAELRLDQDHVVTLEARPANLEGKGAITIRDLVRNSLRMRPDRIVVGECRGGEALDMLQAMNTGHDGSLTTAHANSPRELLSRLETMVLMAGMDLPVRAIREQIAGAVQVIVQQSRMSDGRRQVTHLTEVVGMEGDRVVLQDIFLHGQDGAGAQIQPTGVVSRFVDALSRTSAGDSMNLAH